MATVIKPVGVYRIIPDQTEYERAMTARPDHEFAQKELSSIVLVELSVDGADDRFDLGDFTQAHTEYVPYDETYLDADTGQVLAHAYKRPASGAFIVIFFLHFYEPSQPLNTPYGALNLPAVKPLPERLKWKKYTYWA